MPLHWVNYNINISLKHKYIYFENPKVACSTIKKTLIKWELGELYSRWGDIIHRPLFHTAFAKPYLLHEDMLNKVFNDPEFTKFSFVRSPYTRILSCYLQKIIRKASGFAEISKYLNSKEIEENISFERFLDILLKMTDFEMNSHYRPQYSQLFGDDIELDYIGRFERFDSDFGALLRQLKGDKVSIEEHSKHKTQAQNRLFDYFNDESIEKVNQIYKKDFEKFKYIQLSSAQALKLKL